MKSDKWQFWIDRGGTFTDIVAKRPDGNLVTHKLLSTNPEQYHDASIQGIKDILDSSNDATVPADKINVIKMGTTVGTNALLERKGEKTVLVITKGFKDTLRIGYQNRPDIFALEIKKPQQVYDCVIEVPERYNAEGQVINPPDFESVREKLKSAYYSGFNSIAIAFMHAYRYPSHEIKVAEIAKEIGFSQISMSHDTSPLIKLISRAETTIVDAYLSPVIGRYINDIISMLENNRTHEKDDETEKTRLMFMQSNGGLVNADSFQGKDSILSGPAGGVVGAVTTSNMAGFDKVISFDMGGTSTDVAHYRGEYERSFENIIDGIHLRSPMMQIHTIAAGGGSILHFDGERFKVGPDSAGSDPGPACYRRGGPLTVTDCNLMLNKINPEYFPHVFGPDANLPLDNQLVFEKFDELADKIMSYTGKNHTHEEVAEGFLDVAVENMANAIKKITIQRGYDIKEYALCCFGGAGGQHACKVADKLGINKIFIHPYAGVLSAYGIGLADQREILEHAVEQQFDNKVLNNIKEIFLKLEEKGKNRLVRQGITSDKISSVSKIHLRYKGSDTTLMVNFVEGMDKESIISNFNKKHKQRFGFMSPEKTVVVEAVSMEVISASDIKSEPVQKISKNRECVPTGNIEMFNDGKYNDTPVFRREDIKPGCRIDGPAVIIENTSTIVIEPLWKAEITEQNHIILTSTHQGFDGDFIGTEVDPVILEIFNNRFMSVAEQMGYTLQNTAHSVNIKERRDFSCALFDKKGNLVANAPHIPVHIGSMSECVKSLINSKGADMKKGDVYMLNSPYHGGTHLPDITVVTPVFDNYNNIYSYIASRGHHADIGGITPGSMPPDSKNIHEEGVFTGGIKLVDNGIFQENELVKWLNSGDYPARNPEKNISDIHAQVAANEKGSQELQKLKDQYSPKTIKAYMQYVQDNAESEVCKVIDKLNHGNFSYQLDDGSIIKVQIKIDNEYKNACIDFTGTSSQLSSNFNAPVSVCKAAILYVFRTMIESDIPLNDGCLRPIDIIVPEGSMLNPVYPAAVVAGNVETSQYIVDTLFGALGVMAASQGTMNNFTFGNKSHQYYETICGGSGAGAGFHGTDAVHTHMTNSKITDPEVLESRYPVILEEFSIREGSGGCGRYSGGNGIIRKIRFLEEMDAAILSSHRKYPSFGLYGGNPGKCGTNRVIRKDSSVIEIGGKAKFRVYKDDVFSIETPGGGGYGYENTYISKQ
ncbi:hydantoinase B/oxoprolinase family protein [Methanohalobium sp.]|uniref:hydantoinase B/oxoprolinase family protein n=1 Tax=Methanohalobium sp. TaxID=2837493 RepID=UPI0025E67F4C|nr:hydantoinase B/oxoprolinase family protein [Methanohalobium sp.]